MAKKGKQRAARRSADRPAPAAAPVAAPANPLTSLPCDPPRRHRWFLIASIVGVAGWMLFLVTMVLRG